LALTISVAIVPKDYWYLKTMKIAVTFTNHQSKFPNSSVVAKTLQIAALDSLARQESPEINRIKPMTDHGEKLAIFFALQQIELRRQTSRANRAGREKAG